MRAECSGRDPERDGWPTVSVVVPVRNEGRHLERAVASILAQDYPIAFDVCLAVAPSDDDTRQVAFRLAAHDCRISVVDNPSGSTPAGLNAAIRSTEGSVVVRVDGHATLSEGYVRRAVATMCRTGAVNVGGRQVPTPQTPVEEAIAAAATSWMGTGGASYRVGGDPGPVDTVYLGVFDRAAGDAVCWFDESLIRNQDYELNIRLRDAGGSVWFDPELTVGYRPRGTWRALGEQYRGYGWWKAEVLRRHPGSLRLRQLVPPIAVSASALGVLFGLRWRRALLAPLLYAGAVVAAVGADPRRARVVRALVTMHTCWSYGLLSQLVSRDRRRR
jgi:glycosyltransferase involved in cell wall biosynthesis